MARRALIVESEYQALSGFRQSATCIEQVLRARGFAIAACRGREATRDGILAAYGALIADARADDAVVVYYSGHGGIVANTTYVPDGDLPRYVQHICPSDFARTTEDDFRGITAIELSLLLAALTRRTRNATVILECCYSAQMSRGPAPAPAHQPTPVLTRVGLTKHLRALRERERDFEALELTGNRHAIRVAATGQRGSAFQLPVPPAAALRALGLELPAGAWIGAMTLVLAQLLVEVGDARVAWRSLGIALRTRLGDQRPEIEGPVRRVPFSLATVDADAVAVRSERGVAIIEAGRLLGVSVGDVFGVLADGATEGTTGGPPIEMLTIDEVSATQSRARCRPTRELPPGAVAVAMSRVLPRAAIRVVADDLAPEIAAAVDASPGLRTATADDQPLAELRVRDGMLELHDAGGLLYPAAPCPDRLADAIRDLERLATARRLRTLATHVELAASEVTVELLVAQDGAFRPLAEHGEPLGLRDRIAVRIVNRGDARLFAHVFNVGLRRRIARLSAHAALGIELPTGEPQYVGTSAAGQLTGFNFRWPDGLPRDRARLDTVLVVLMAEPADLSVLERGEHLAASRGKPPALEDVLGPVAGATMRGPSLAPGAFALCWRELPLFPIDATLCIGVPQVDASPIAVDDSHPAALRIRLAGLAVAPDTRVDVLVCARSAALPYRATTLTGAAPSELEVWAGALRGAADLYVWTSPGGHDQPSLRELLAHRPLGEPLAILRAPHDDPRAILAPGARLQLAATARAALRGIGDITTAFRGSFGPGDGAAQQRFEAAAVAFDVAIDVEVSASGVARY